MLKSKYDLELHLNISVYTKEESEKWRGGESPILKTHGQDILCGRDGLMSGPAGDRCVFKGVFISTVYLHSFNKQQ